MGSPRLPTNASAAPDHHATGAADSAAAACRSIQLQRRFCELAGGLVGPEKGMVLQGPWQGLCKPGRRMHDIIGALRLQCRLCQLDGRLVNPEEKLVLLKQGQGLPASSWRMCLTVNLTMGSFLAVALVLGTIFWCCCQVLSMSNLKSTDFAVMAWRCSSAGACAIFWSWICYASHTQVILSEKK